MVYTNGRNAEQLTRKDTLFAAISMLALLDKRSIAKKLAIESVADLENVVTELAAKFAEYIANGRAKNGSANSLECGSCEKSIDASAMVETRKDGVSTFVCYECFDAIGDYGRWLAENPA